MPKSYVRRAVAYRVPCGIGALRVVTAKLPQQDEEYEYRTRSALEEHDRIAWEVGLQPLTDDEAAPSNRKRP
jgi:hypothetical protein